MVGKSNIFGKTALILALVAVFAGCEKAPISEEDHWAELCGDKPLRFAASSAPETKATEFPDGSDFGVFAFLQEGNVSNGTVAHWNDTPGNGGKWNSAFMFNQQVEKSGGAYTYSPLRYWPYNEENTISFWAYSPYNSSVAVYEAGSSNTYDRTSTSLPDIRFSVPSNGKDDFMTADIVTDQTYGHTNSPNANTVKFDFHHRLAKVEFKAKPYTDYVNDNGTPLPADQQVTFKVKTIEIRYSYNTADFHQNPADNSISWSNYTGEQTTPETGSIVAFNNNSGFAIGTDHTVATSVTGSDVYMIPQNLYHGGTLESGKYVTVYVKYIQVEGGMSSEREASGTLYIDADGKREWTANSHYVYTFALKPNDGLHITVEVEKWDKWLEVSNYQENVTVTYPLTFDADTYTSITTEKLLSDLGDNTNYSVVRLKSGATLNGSFIFDTPYNGLWFAVLEPILGSSDGSIAFEVTANNTTTLQPQVSGRVGDEVAIKIKARDASVSTNQFARLRMFCVTEGGQVVAVQEGSIGGPYIIAQYVN